MTIPPADLAYIEETFRHAAAALLEAYEDGSRPHGPTDTTPDLLTEAMEQLLYVLRRWEQTRDAAESDPADAPLESKDIHSLGDHGLDLLTDLADWARELHMAEPQIELGALRLPLALWVIRQGGEISRLGPVVDALAAVANRIKVPQALEQLYVYASQIMEAVTPSLAQDLDRRNPGRPWRILVLNRAIIATRSHVPALMEQAFQSLVELLPEDAPDFFREGMEQMDALGYPPPVREVMEKYYQLWCTPKTLH